MAQGEWQETTQLIRAALLILRQQQPMTVRQLFYQMVVRELIKNIAADYRRVSRMMTIARNDGRCPWEWIVDRSRQVYEPNVFDNPSEYAKVVKEGYRRNYWQDQPCYTEV
jgi:hypothetical protein